MLLILIALLLIQTDWGQNLIIKQVTRKLSKDLNTEVSIKRISIDFFDKLNLEGALIRDQKKDTLLYAGKLKTQVTDWFFLKDEIELKRLVKLKKVPRPAKLDRRGNED